MARENSRVLGGGSRMLSEGCRLRDFRGSAPVSAIAVGDHEHDGTELAKAGRSMIQRQIYFAECDGRIKIGITRNVQQRLSSLRTGAGAPINLIASVDGDEEIERSLHRKLRRHHLDGEWFRDCAEVRAAIQNSLNNFPEAKPDRRSKAPGNKKFSAVAKLLWPEKTAEKLAKIAGCNERTAARWLSGEFEPPGIVIAAIVYEITRRN